MSTRTESISAQFRQRAAATTTTVETEEPEVLDEEVTEEEVTEEDEVDDLPDDSWKKSDVVDYLVDSGIAVDVEDLKTMTKAELLDRFVG